MPARWLVGLASHHCGPRPCTRKDRGETCSDPSEILPVLATFAGRAYVFKSSVGSHPHLQMTSQLPGRAACAFGEGGGSSAERARGQPRERERHEDGQRKIPQTHLYGIARPMAFLWALRLMATGSGARCSFGSSAKVTSSLCAGEG